MPITNFLNLADVYRSADQSRAAQQEFNLRNLQIDETKRKMQEQATLADIARHSGGDYERMAKEALQYGYTEPAMKYGERADATKKRKFELTKQQAETVGQLADESLVYDEDTYQRVLGQLEQFDPDAANTLRQKFPNFTKESMPLLRQIGLQAMTPYQRESLRLQKEKIDAKKTGNSQDKASDFNSFMRYGGGMLNMKIVPLGDGSFQITALNPEHNVMWNEVSDLAWSYFKQGMGRTGSWTKAFQDLKQKYPQLPVREGKPQPSGDGPAPAGPSGKPFVPISDKDKANAIKLARDPSKREEVIRRLKSKGHDTSFLPPVEERPTLPKATIVPKGMVGYEGTNAQKLIGGFRQKMESAYLPDNEDPFDQ